MQPAGGLHRMSVGVPQPLTPTLCHPGGPLPAPQGRSGPRSGAAAALQALPQRGRDREAQQRAGREEPRDRQGQEAHGPRGGRAQGPQEGAGQDDA